jgi:sarcosine oxidase
MQSLLPDLRVPFRVTRQVFGWFEPAEPAKVVDGKLPVFMIESRHGIHYGFPTNAEGLVKASRHPHSEEAVDPDAGTRPPDAADEAIMRNALARHVPAINGRLAGAGTCLYTMTPDGDFVIDRLPGADNVIVVSPCSGHGFKFAPAIGEIAADLATMGATRHDISRFRIGRFG